MNPRVAAQLVSQSLLFLIILLLLLPSARAQRAMTNSKQRISLSIKRTAGRILQNKPKLNIINGYKLILVIIYSNYNSPLTTSLQMQLNCGYTVHLSLSSTISDAAIILLFLAIMFTFPDLFTILYM